MNAEASLTSTHGLAHVDARRSVGHRRIGGERGIRMSLSSAVGAAVIAVAAWAIGTVLLHWVTLD
jgi:hypothetical protein